MSGYSSSQRAPEEIFSEFYNCDAEWSEVKVIDTEELAEVKELFSNLRGDIQLLKDNQPSCFVHPQTYDKDYSRFCEDVEKVFKANDSLRERVAALLVTPEKVARLDAAITKLSCYLEVNDWVYDARYFEAVIERLTDLRENLTSEKLQLASELQEISKTLEQNDGQLESLLQPTHNWVEDGHRSRHCDKCNRRLNRR